MVITEADQKHSGRLSWLYMAEKYNGHSMSDKSFDALVYRKNGGNLEQMNIFRIFADEF